ncbi:hypothetical protein [Xenorhabdus bharatensis]|uniref:hypothetical protein n=1 Tax=Xenorhabdus bharatensis TaxID=3136256 RepID=UPI0030F48AEF
MDAIGLAKIINEFRSIRVQAKEYKLKGVSYIKITGKRAVKSIITGSRYRINDHRILKIGIGSKNVVNGIVSGTKICVYFSLAYRAVEFMTKDEYSLADFIGNITVDTAKLIISALLTAAIGKAASTYFLAAGASIIGVSAGLFFLGVVIAVALFYIDKELGISEKVIESIREADEKIPGDYYEINRQRMALSSPAIWPWN